jgi:hypothetical protein
MTPLAPYLNDYDIHLNIGMLWIAHNDKQPIYDIASEEYQFLVAGSSEEACLKTAREMYPECLGSGKIEAVCAPTVGALHTHRLLNLDGKRVSVGSATGVREPALSPVCSPGGLIYPALDNFLFYGIKLDTPEHTGFLMTNIDGEEGVTGFTSAHLLLQELGEGYDESIYVAAISLADFVVRDVQNLCFRRKMYDIKSVVAVATECIDTFDKESEEN